jgi:F0F1-type ATP synthase delta subunit
VHHQPLYDKFFHELFGQVLAHADLLESQSQELEDKVLEKYAATVDINRKVPPGDINDLVFCKPVEFCAGGSHSSLSSALSRFS